MEGVFQYYLEVLFWFWKNFLKFQKNLKKPFEKEQFYTDFRYLWRFGNFWSVEKIFYLDFPKKSFLAFLVAF